MVDRPPPGPTGCRSARRYQRSCAALSGLKPIDLKDNVSGNLFVEEIESEARRLAVRPKLELARGAAGAADGENAIGHPGEQSISG